MKTFLKLLFFVVLALPALGAQPPVIRNGWTTNAEALLPFRVKSTNEVYFGDSSIYVFKRAINSYYYGTSAGQADDGTSSGSVGIGIQALTACSNGLGNVAIGANSLVSLTNDAGGLFSYGNTAVGLESGYTVLNGVNGIYIGRQSGTIAGGGTLGGVDNICIGYRAGFIDALTNTVTIGSESVASNDNTFVLGRGDMQDYVFRGQTYTFPSVRGTNEYLFIGDGGQLYWTNVVSFTTNISGDSFVTNLTVYSNAYFYSTAYINNSYITNLTVVSNAFIDIAYITNLTVVSNAYFPKHAYISNLYATNIFIESSQYLTNTITEANPLFVDFNTNTYQFMDAAGDVEVHTTNRIAKTGIRFCTVFVQNKAATNITLTFDTNWINFVGNTLLITNGKWGVFTLGLKGTTESDVIASHETQGN